MSHSRAILVSLAATALVLATACASDAGTAPAGLAPSSPNRVLGVVGSVFNVQLRAFPNDPIFPTDPVFGFGHLQIRLGSLIDQTCLPPSPITPQPGQTVLSVCGRIFNEGGALYRGGAIYMNQVGGDGSILIAQFANSYPVDPCRRYEIGGAVIVSDEVASDMIANPTRYRVSFDGTVSGRTTSIAGTFDGSAWGPVGTRPETDPYFAAKVCSVAITP